MPATSETLFALRRSLAAIERSGATPRRCTKDIVPIDQGPIDVAIGGGLPAAALHEVLGDRQADAAAARGFAGALALRRAGAARPIAWALEETAIRESGMPSGDGLACLGFDPARVLLVRARDATGVLRAAADAAACRGLAAIVLEIWGLSKALDLTATRRLTLAAQRSGVMVVLTRPGIRPQPSAAETRWSVRAIPSAALATKAPGFPAFDLTLLRHRHGVPGGPWRVEWNSDDHLFSHLQAPLPGDRLPVLHDRPAAAHPRGTLLRLAG